MGRTALAVAVSLFLAPMALHATPKADEITKLRQQVQDLQARNDALQRLCVSASTAPVAASPVAAMATAAPVPVTAITSAVSAAAPVAAVSAPVAPAAPGTAATPTVSTAPAVTATVTADTADTADMPPAKPKKPYSDAGCDEGFFSGPKKGLWQKTANWDKVVNGESMAQVETVLGVEHYDVNLKKGGTQWEYGRCGSSWAGAVQFSNGAVVSVTAPDR